MKRLNNTYSNIKKMTGVAALAIVVISGFLISGMARAAGPAFVQVVATQPQTPQTSVSVAYSKAQAAGDTNILAIGWGDTTSSIASVTDSKGNTYTVAAPTTRGSLQSQAIYYAKNISAATANTNTVTVTFNTPAQYVDLRASEYSGLDTASPLDKTASAVGTAGTASTPSATTAFSNELIFGAGDTSGAFSAAGTNFTKRLITNPDSDIVEDRVVTATGSYNASARQNGAWVMQMASFKAAGSAPDTTPPSVPTGLTGTAASSTQASLSWTASTDNVGVTGYNIYRNGTKVATSPTTSYVDNGLSAGTTYTYTVAAYDAAGNTSNQSSGFNITTPAPDTTPPSVPTGLSATAVSSSEIDLSWSASTDNVGVTGYKVYNGGNLVATVIGTSYKNTGLSASTTYSYTVSAIDAAGNESAQSTAASATTQAPDTTPPSVPTDLSASAVSSSQINLSWTASTDNVSVAGYNVYRNGTLIVTTTSTSYTDTGLSQNTTYAYTVTAYDAAGNESAQSTAASATTTNTASFVQADDTGTFTGNDTGLSSGASYQVLAHPTKVGDAVVLITQSLTDPNRTTNTITSISSNIGTFHYVNSYNDDADNEIWICPSATGAADTVAVNTPTNAWQAFAVEFNEPATGYTDAGGRVDNDLGYLSNQSFTVTPKAAGDAVVVTGDTLDAYTQGPAAPWTFYNHGYWDFDNGTSAAWQIVPSTSPVTVTWQTLGGLSSIQGVDVQF